MMRSTRPVYLPPGVGSSQNALLLPPLHRSEQKGYGPLALCRAVRAMTYFPDRLRYLSAFFLREKQRRDSAAWMVPRDAAEGKTCSAQAVLPGNGRVVDRACRHLRHWGLTSRSALGSNPHRTNQNTCTNPTPHPTAARWEGNAAEQPLFLIVREEGKAPCCLDAPA